MFRLLLEPGSIENRAAGGKKRSRCSIRRLPLAWIRTPPTSHYGGTAQLNALRPGNHREL